jgi:hypothetical protein
MDNASNMWITQLKEDARRFNCTVSYRAARRVPLASPDERPPYILTVVGEHGGHVIKTIQESIYKDWPLDEEPPPPVSIDGVDAPEPDDAWGRQFVYTYQVPGKDPVDVRMFSFKGLAIARREKLGGLKGPLIKSKRKAAPGGGLTPSQKEASEAAKDDITPEPGGGLTQKEKKDASEAAAKDTPGGGLTPSSEEKNDASAAAKDTPSSEEKFLQAMRNSMAAVSAEMGTDPPPAKQFTLNDLKCGAFKTIEDLAQLNTARDLDERCCLCVTTMGRDEQLKKALPVILAVAWGHAEVSVHVVDFNGHDDLEKWVLDNLALADEVGKLKYYRCKALKSWHASKAKNTAHMAAVFDVRGGLTPPHADADQDAVLVNLDCDNVITPSWLRKLLTQDARRLIKKEVTVVHYQNPWDGGTYGRLAYMASLFEGVRGYDVEFLPMGCQDTDLVKRLGTGGKVLDVKQHHVGISFPNAPKTGDAAKDRKANWKAPTTCQGRITATRFHAHMPCPYAHMPCPYAHMPCLPCPYAVHAVRASMHAMPLCRACHAPDTPGEDCELRLARGRHAVLHPDGPEEPRENVREPKEPADSGSQPECEVVVHEVQHAWRR